MTLPTTRTRIRPTRTAISEEQVEVRVPDPAAGAEPYAVDLGDLRALVATTTGLPDTAVVTVDGLVPAEMGSPICTVTRLVVRGKTTTA